MNWKVEKSLEAKENEGIVEANCPVCGAYYFLNVSLNRREGKLCPNCLASGRAQAIAYCISKILLGKMVPLSSHKKDRTKRIIGLSDGGSYADILNRNYTHSLRYGRTFSCELLKFLLECNYEYDKDYICEACLKCKVCAKTISENEMSIKPAKRK